MTTKALLDLRTVARDGRRLRIALRGELDCYTAEQVAPRLRALAARSGRRDLVLDLRELAFCDSSGIELFLGLARRCRAGGTRLLLVEVPPLVAKSIRVLAADRDLRLPTP
ncbi:STAS domain-containing protein [Streptomyces sp. NPDC097619]|uniref:STAS domain-containing protein n=1 Tax=Streptomyces sp. NPDC097619 TaxID=3157228 RepID=UPI00332B9891